MKTFQAPCGLAPSVYDVDFLCFLVFRKLIKLFEEIVNEVGDLNNIPVFEYSLNSDGGTFDFEFEWKEKTLLCRFIRIKESFNIKRKQKSRNDHL